MYRGVFEVDSETASIPVYLRHRCSALFRVDDGPFDIPAYRPYRGKAFARLLFFGP
jgi:hypothetical protein